METQPRQAPKREGCKEAILALLEQHGGEMPVKELEEGLREMGYSYKVIGQAKAVLKQEQVVSYRCTGKGQEKIWFIALST